ncbi:30S ribosomal protein S6 [endosymbiont of Euscepes postfasciatus]|uniref:30S ribosomal protein S6 n=1 Tax=endosymbiont of Euscepes postfasciatus TaxID=650377 RepID=UPI000DC6FE59|nr:30S ribosomal protein S6 [endosymbiont of Euscepes postfasciatus]BBA84591.1 30S ribosomal protein S6 [endosymbiont of Euscepes postfasciatus]
MRYYEIMILINPIFQNKIDEIIINYSEIINNNLGKIYKFEKIGIRDLCYPIKKNNKAYFLLTNIQCNVNIIKVIENLIKTNEIIIRYLILKIKNPTNKFSKLYKYE